MIGYEVTSPTAAPFEFGTRLGIVFIVQSAMLSALAVSGLLIYILYSAVAVRQSANRRWTSQTHVHYYFLNLLVSDLIQAVGGVISAQWVADARVTEGLLCTTQGILKQVGDVGVALTTMTIALHTFCVLVFHWKTKPAAALFMIALIWTFIGLIVGLSFGLHGRQGYYGNTQYWCWITSDFPKQRIGLEYFWLWLAAFVNIVVYAFLALVVKGWLAVENGKIKFSSSRLKVANELALKGDVKESGAVAMQLLFYPAVYIITVLPVAVVRWMAFSGDTNVPFGATAFASILFSSSGLLNVILFRVTRPRLIPGHEKSFESYSYDRYHYPAPPGPAIGAPLSFTARRRPGSLQSTPGGRSGSWTLSWGPENDITKVESLTFAEKPEGMPLEPQQVHSPRRSGNSIQHMPV